MNLSWMPRFLANSFLGLNADFSIQIDFSKKIHFVYSKLILRPKNCFLEIGVSNLEGPYDLTFCAQSCTAHQMDIFAQEFEPASYFCDWTCVHLGMRRQK